MAHDQEVVGLKPDTVYWMDVSNASYYIQENNENKGSQTGHTKKIFKKRKMLDIGTKVITLTKSVSCF
jgi:hypothetical protein